MATQVHGDHLFQAGGEMGQLMRDLDWSSTPLGPVADWPQSLRTAVSICLASRFPMLIWWGSDLVMLYNDAYRPLLGATKHPAAMGARGHDMFPEIWDVIGPMLQGVLARGDATWSDNQLLLLDRNSYVEECYFTFSYSPIHDESGGIGGVFTAVTETTSSVLGARRLELLQRLAVETGQQSTAESVCQTAASIIAEAPRDIPFATLCLVMGEEAQLVAATPSSGLSLDPRGDAQTAEIDSLPWPGPGDLTVREFSLPASIRNGLHLQEPLGAIRDGVILTLSSAQPDTPIGYMIAGISPQRALDDEYRSFLQLVAGQITTAINGARAREEERRRLEALAELDRAKTMFFTNISHEFRTPLTLLLGPIEDALSDSQRELEPPQRERLEIVRRNALRLLRLVNTLLDFASIERGGLAPHFETTDLARYTADLASCFRSAIERAGLALQVDIDAQQRPVAIDRDMWEKIVFNLVANAFKYTTKGTITVRLRETGDRIRLEVSDTGIGMPESELPHIFSRFHRVPVAGGRSSEGTGIGLALVSEMVKAQDGEVSVESIPGAGSTFTVTLPTHHCATRDDVLSSVTVHQISAQAAHYIEDAGQWSINTLVPAGRNFAPAGRALAGWSTANESDTDAAFDSDGGTVLVVDDNADMREYLQRLLAPSYDVIVAANGADALALIEARRPGLILSDVMMPEMDGFALVRQLRAEPRTANLPVILLSARAGREAAIEGLEAGADDYLIKPFAAQELLARVNTHFRLAMMRTRMVHQREDFITSAAHDLKTPLTSIKGHVQLLLRRLNRGVVTPTEITHDLTTVERATTRMIKVINEFLDITRLESEGTIDLIRRPTDLVLVVRRAVAEIAPSGVHTIRLDVDEERVLGDLDGDRVRRVVDNVLTNAIRYSPDGGEVTVRLRSEMRNDQEWAVVTISDHGVGIPETELGHVFERFYRARNAGERSHGTGIGLTSARMMVEQHGGSIEIESTPGVGTTVQINLPLREMEPALAS